MISFRIDHKVRTAKRMSVFRIGLTSAMADFTLVRMCVLAYPCAGEGAQAGLWDFSIRVRLKILIRIRSIRITSMKKLTHFQQTHMKSCGLSYSSNQSMIKN